MGRVTRRSVASKEESTPKESPKSSSRRGAKKEKPGAEDVTEGDTPETPKRGGRQTVKDEQKAEVSAKGKSTARGRSASRGGRAKKEEETEDVENEEEVEEVEEKKPARGGTRSRGKGKAAQDNKTEQNTSRGGRGAKSAEGAGTDDEDEENDETSGNNRPAKSSSRRARGKAPTVTPSPREGRGRSRTTAEPDSEDKIEEGENNHEHAEQSKELEDEAAPKGRHSNVAAKEVDSSEVTPSPGTRKGRNQKPAPKTTPTPARSSRRSGAGNDSADKISDNAETEDMDTTEAESVHPETSEGKEDITSTKTGLNGTESLAAEKVVDETEKPSTVEKETKSETAEEAAIEKKASSVEEAAVETKGKSTSEEAAMETEDKSSSTKAAVETDTTPSIKKTETEKEQSDVVVEETPVAASKKRKLEDEDDSPKPSENKRSKQEEAGEAASKNSSIETIEPVQGDKQSSAETSEPIEVDSKTEEPVKDDKPASTKTIEPNQDDKQTSIQTDEPIEEDKPTEEPKEEVKQTDKPIQEDKQASTKTDEPIEETKQTSVQEDKHPSTETNVPVQGDNGILVDTEDKPESHPPLAAEAPSTVTISEQIKVAPSPTKKAVSQKQNILPTELPSPHKPSSVTQVPQPQATAPPATASHPSKPLPEAMETEPSPLTHASSAGTTQAPCQNGTAEISELHLAPSPTIKPPTKVDKPYVPSSTAIDSRKFISNPVFPVELMDPAYCFSVVSYNILADCHLSRSDYTYTQPQYLLQGYRHILLLKELDYLDGDIVCLQEVGSSYYSQTLLPALKSRGYDGHFIKRTTENMDEGEATFVKTSKLEVISQQSMSLKDLAFKEVDSSGLPEAVSLAAKKYLDRADVILLTELKCKKTSKTLTVCNIHVFHDTSAPDAQCVQAACAIKQLVAKAGGDLSPHIICGDFNSDLASPVYHLVKDGYLSDDHIRRLTSLEALDNTDGSSRSLIHHIGGAFKHTSSTLKNAYEVALNKEPPVTCFRKATKSLDHIFHSSASIDNVGVLETLDVEVLTATAGLPSKTIPSDHLSIKAMFRLK